MITVDVDPRYLIATNHPVHSIKWNDLPAKELLIMAPSLTGRLNGEYKNLREEVEYIPGHELAELVWSLEALQKLNVRENSTHEIYLAVRRFTEATKNTDWNKYAEQNNPKTTEARHQVGARIRRFASIAEEQLPKMRKVLTYEPTQNKETSEKREYKTANHSTNGRSTTTNGRPRLEERARKIRSPSHFEIDNWLLGLPSSENDLYGIKWSASREHYSRLPLGTSVTPFSSK